MSIIIQILICRTVWRCLFESFYVAFFKKRPPIQRAERWSPPQRRNLLFGVFFFAKLFSLRLWSQRKKRVNNVENACVERGTPHLCGSPLPSPSSAFTPLWRRGRREEFRPLRRATADRGGSDELLKKLEQNFHTDTAVKSPPNQNLKHQQMKKKRADFALFFNI